MTDNLTFKNLGILFTFYSIIYVFVYYGFYGINIFYYTDLQGVLTLFLSNTIKIIIFSTLVLLVVAGTSKKSFQVKNQTFNKLSIRKTIAIFYILFIIFIGLFIMLLLGIDSSINRPLFSVTALVVIGIIHAIDRLSKLIRYKFKITSYNLKAYFSVILIIPYFMCQLIINEVNYFPKSDRLYFCYNESKIVETGKKFNIYLIGKTNDNIFIYDKSKNQTLIYEMSNVKDFKIYDVPVPNLYPKDEAVTPNKVP
ncbi:hypothetical protein [Flavobacterium sp. PS2]|uniref:hypothetical protein n=1 Tax=Flavobacterium sp. PS2 TaxID=3384157 RepID=UPI00390CAF2A